MICVVYEGYGSSIPTLIFITCIWLPFLQIKHALFDILSTIFTFFNACHHDHLHQDVFPNIFHHSDLQFNDLLINNNGGDNAGSTMRLVDESCSICLAEFQDEDIVSQLSRCRHVFHTCCIESWLHQDQFTCPLCRSNLLHIPDKPVKQRQIYDHPLSQLRKQWYF